MMVIILNCIINQIMQFSAKMLDFIFFKILHHSYIYPAHAFIPVCQVLKTDKC